MNFRFTMLLLAVLVVGGGIFAIFQSGRSSEPEPLEPWLWKTAVEDLRRISVTHDGQSQSFRQDEEQWVIEDGNDTPVFQERWGGITLLLSGPRGDRTLSATIDDPAKYGLDLPQTIIQVTERSGQLIEVQLGDPTPDEENQYIRLADGSLSTIAKPWADVVTGLVTRPPYAPPWLETLGVARIKAVGVTIPGQEETMVYGIGEDQWIIFPEDGNDTLADPAAWDAIALLFNGQLPETVSQELDDPARYGLDSPYILLDFETHEGEVINFQIGDLTPDRESRYIRQWQPRSGQLLTVEQSWVELLERMATDPPYPPPADAEATAG